MRRTLSTTRYRRGEVILVNFVFSEEAGVKRRPAVVVRSQAYNRGRQEAIIAAVTSNVGRLLVGDHLIAAWKEAGLLYPSVATGIIRTIKQAMIARRLGSLTEQDLRAVSDSLRLSLDLAP